MSQLSEYETGVERDESEWDIDKYDTKTEAEEKYVDERGWQGPWESMRQSRR